MSCTCKKWKRVPFQICFQQNIFIVEMLLLFFPLSKQISIFNISLLHYINVSAYHKLYRHHTMNDAYRYVVSQKWIKKKH